MNDAEIEELYDRYFGEGSRRPMPYVPWWLPLVPAGWACWSLATWNDPATWWLRLAFALGVVGLSLLSGVMWERYVDQETILQRIRRRRGRSDRQS